MKIRMMAGFHSFTELSLRKSVGFLEWFDWLADAVAEAGLWGFLEKEWSAGVRGRARRKRTNQQIRVVDCRSICNEAVTAKSLVRIFAFAMQGNGPNNLATGNALMRPLG